MMKLNIRAAAPNGEESMLAHYQQLVEAAGDVMYTCDWRGYCTYVNASVKRLFGYEPEAVVGRYFTDFIHPEWRERVLGFYIEQFQARKEETTYEFPALTQWGEVKWVEQIVILQTDGERVTGFLGFVRDITRRKKAEDELQQNVNTFTAMFETSTDLIFIKDRALRYTLFNPAGVRMMGRPLTEIIGKTDTDLFGDEIGQQVGEIDGRVLASGARTTYEIKRQLAEGERWLLVTKYPLLSAQGDVLGIVGIGHDITERKQVEAALMAGEANLLALMNNSHDSIFSMDLERRLITYNATFEKRFMTNFGIQLHPGMKLEDHVPKRMREDWLPWLNRALAGERFSVEYRYVSNGVEGFTDINFNPITTPDGTITGVAMFNRDTTARKQTEAALIASEANLSALMDNSTDTIFSGDHDMRILALNATFKQRFKLLFGADIDVGIRLPDVVPPQVAAQWIPWYQRALAGETFTVEQEISTKNRTFFFEITYNPIITAGVVTGVAVFSRDVSARMVAERALRESEQRYRAVMDNQSDLISRSLPDTTLTFVNDAYCRFFGKTREALIGHSHLILSPESTHEAMRARIEMWNKNPGIYTNEVRQVMPGGEVRWIEWTDQGILNEKGEAVEFQSAGRDVTRRKLAELAHLESEQRYRAVVEQQRDLVSRSTPDMVLTFVNDAYCHYFGKSRDELIGQSFLSIVPAEYHEAIREKFADMTRDPSVRSDERHYVTGGEIRWLEWTNHAILDDQGVVVEFQSTGRDVTERKRAEDERNDYIRQLEILQRLDTELSQTLKLDYVLGVALDAAVRMSGANAGAIHLVEDGGLMRIAAIIGDYPGSKGGGEIASGAGIIGRVAQTLLPEWVEDVRQDKDYVANVPSTRSQITTPLLSQERLIGTLNVQTSDPKRFSPQIFDFIKLLGARIASSLDNARLYQILQRQYDELQNVHAQVSDLEQLKSQIIRIAAHDLRNPLGVISGYLQVIEYDPDLKLPQHTLGQLKIIGESAGRIDKISRDILTLEKVQSSGRGIHLDTIHLTEMIQTATGEYQAEAALHNFDFGLEANGRKLTIQGDALLLREAVNNLIGNAFKYTPDGGRVTLRLFEQDEWGVFEVEDTGIGIPSDKLDELFKPFSRIKDKSTRHIPGTGLGLSLVKSIVERHSGSVFVRSVYGEGSTFGFRLPLARRGKKGKA